jgi:hypothetical protein
MMRRVKELPRVISFYNALPFALAGIGTFLFTDIEGGTALWERDHQAMAAAVARHMALLDAAIQAQGGVPFKTVGDAVQAAFPTAPPPVLQHWMLSARCSPRRGGISSLGRSASLGATPAFGRWNEVGVGPRRRLVGPPRRFSNGLGPVRESIAVMGWRVCFLPRPPTRSVDVHGARALPCPVTALRGGHLEEVPARIPRFRRNMRSGLMVVPAGRPARLQQSRGEQRVGDPLVAVDLTPARAGQPHHHTGARAHPALHVVRGGHLHEGVARIPVKRESRELG